MEIFELRYFLAVAAVENVNRAAQDVHVSAGSLSKAIARLEEELQTSLFYKVGRGIRLTKDGIYLRRKAAEILGLEESVRIDFRGKEPGLIQVVFGAEEILLASFGSELIQRIKEVFPAASFRAFPMDCKRLMEEVAEGRVHLALTTQAVPKGFAVKTFAEVEFQTCASALHPLLRAQEHRSKRPSFSISEILQHEFVVPESALLGRIKSGVSADGWRDDHFARKIGFHVGTLSLAESLIQRGFALGYLPDHRISAAGLLALAIRDCPYVCRQKVKVVAKDPNALGWLQSLWRAL